MAGIFSFFEHPQRVLHDSKEPAVLTSTQHRLFLFNELGIDLCFLVHFTMEFSRIEPEDFVEKWLIKYLGSKEIHLGYNAHFGVGRRGDAYMMQRLAQKLGFTFFQAKPVQVDGDYVSSSLIRKRVSEGDLDRARTLLGRPFGLFASVIRGSGRGKALGYPTANLRPHSEILPPCGVYAVRAREKLYHLRPIAESDEFRYVPEKAGDWYEGVLNLGSRPTFAQDKNNVIPEVHLLNFKGDLYGKTLEIEFHAKLRDEVRFSNPKELVSAIEGDIQSTKFFFNPRAEIQGRNKAH
jgi:riboflavin kinase/FMN adenylyltransferase